MGFTKSIGTQVLISGAGPAGLSLAIELGSRGIACMVVDPRTTVDSHPRASLLGPRSMEYFRRHGLADALIRAGIPSHLPYEIRFVTALTGRRIYHWSTLSHDALCAMHRGERPAVRESGWSPYTRVQIGQHAIEPILRQRIAELPRVDMRAGCELQDFTQDEAGVTATIATTDGGEITEVRAEYLAGCDGGRSVTRRKLGIEYTGRGPIGRNRSFLLHAPKLADTPGMERANLHFVYKPGVYGVPTDIDGNGLYAYSHFEPGPSDQDIDPREVLRDAAGTDFEFEVKSVKEWWHHQSVANRFRVGRVFLLGDAAHLFCPSGGIGMNTAIGDAFDLGWKLDARIHGWGGETLLDSYERERWPLAMRNTINSASNRDRLDAVMDSLPAEIDEETSAGVAARTWLDGRFKWLAKQFGSAGAHLGLRYTDSPVIVHDGTPEPPDDIRLVIPTTWPGSRAPHAWLSPGVSTLDLFDGSAFVLVGTGPESSDRTELVDAARSMAIPLSIHRLPDAIAQLYERRWVLVRPDGHVCWRGDELPASPADLLRTVTGQASNAPR